MEHDGLVHVERHAAEEVLLDALRDLRRAAIDHVAQLDGVAANIRPELLAQVLAPYSHAGVT